MHQKNTKIRQQILEQLQKIPKGKVMSYKTIADMFWVHPRTVAAVMKYNKYPDTYPCYKVISHSWNLWGYSAKEGQITKMALLKAEGIPIRLMKVPKEYIL